MEPELRDRGIFRLNAVRPNLIDDVVARTTAEFAGKPAENQLSETLYLERRRLRNFHPTVFTKGRKDRDLRLYNDLQKGLLRSPGEADRGAMLERVTRHFAEEIGGHFDPAIYRIASHAVPWGFNWLLNAASVRRFLPWGLTESLESRINVHGEIDSLRALSRRGTILLVPTHQSNIDSVLIGYIIYLLGLPPFAYGAGLNLYSNPVLNFFMSNLGAYTVDRAKTNEIYKSTLKNYSIALLQEGIHSIFFPGGGRSRSGAVESKLKLGLLGTGLQAQIQGYQAGKPNPNVYVVPMVMSYHFVLEAASLIEAYLAESGGHRFILAGDESWQVSKVARFFWKFFSSQAGLHVSIGRPLDVFGNFVDEEGRSIGPNGTLIDPKRWLMTRGELCADEQRDREYTRELGRKIVDRFHRENVVLTSHAVAFAFFEMIRQKYPDFDLYRILRLSHAQRSRPTDDFLSYAEGLRQRLIDAEKRGDLKLSDELRSGSGAMSGPSPLPAWIADGMAQLGLLHESPVLEVSEDIISAVDMNLLYYYRNRLSGYGLSILAETGGPRKSPGEHDEKGFLA